MCARHAVRQVTMLGSLSSIRRSAFNTSVVIGCACFTATWEFRRFSPRMYNWKCLSVIASTRFSCILISFLP